SIKSQSLSPNPNDLKTWEANWGYYTCVYDTLSSKCVIYKPLKYKYAIKKERKDYSFLLGATMIIPKDTFSINLDFECKNIDTLKFTTLLYDKNERLIKKQNHYLKTSASNNIKIHNDSASFMIVHLAGTGILKDIKDTLMCEIKSVNFPVYSFKNGNDDKELLKDTLKASDIFPIINIGQLAEFKEKKIFGLGESFHGGKTIWQKKYSIIRDLLDNNLKLICFEIGVDVVLTWDQYIQGISTEDYRYKIIEDAKYTAGDANTLIRLLDYLRFYNSKKEDNERVHVVGLDLRSEKFYLFEYLKNYRDISKHPKKIDNFILNNLIKIIYDYTVRINQPFIDKNKAFEKGSLSTLVEPILKEKEFEKVMKKNDLSFFISFLNYDVPTYTDYYMLPEYVYGKRDSLMWNTLQSAINCYAKEKDDKVAISAHSFHLAKTYAPDNIRSDVFKSKNLGCYIYDRYKDDFWTTSFHAAKGVHSSAENNIKMNSPLSEPWKGSFEDMCSYTTLTNFYCRKEALGETYIFRFIPQGDAPLQFSPYSKDRFDAYIFIEENFSGVIENFNDETQKNRENAMNRYITNLGIINNSLSDKFDLFIDSVSIIIPKNFKWNSTYCYTPLNDGSTQGFFISDDKQCIIGFSQALNANNSKKILSEKVEKILFSKDKVYSIKQMAVRDLLHQTKLLDNDYKFKYGLDRDNMKNHKNYDIILEKYINYWTDERAKSIYNADKALDFEYNNRMSSNDNYFYPYTHAEAVYTEKNGKTVVIRCLYTDNGYKNKEKYKKAKESIFRFK
ncbi:MAG: erythromycin esterase family protein, partial [Bacteroidales bacterium]|nr:erythromycin esterase family protein [Bacteroidales bacterium]